MITFPCLSTTHSSCSAESTCECHCHSIARLPPVELDYSVSKSDTTIDKENVIPHSYPRYDTIIDTPSLPVETTWPNAESIQAAEQAAQQREDLEMIDYNSDLELESAYVQGEDLTYFGYQILEGIDEPVRPPTKQELEKEARSKEIEERRKALVAQAVEKTKPKPVPVATAKQTRFEDFFGG